MSDSKNLKVLVLRADDGGCGFYRMKEPARVVRDVHGVNVEVRSDIPCEAEINRDGSITIYSLDIDANIIVFQRPLLATFCAVIDYAQRHGIACVVEMDDDLNSVHSENVAHHWLNPKTNKMSNWDHVNRACEMADWVTVSTPRLAKVYGKHGRCSVIRNYIPERILSIEKEVADEPRVGWTGTVQTHPRDLDVPGTHVGTAVGRWGTAFNVVGDGAGIYEKLYLQDGTKVEATGWIPLDNYYEMIAEKIDIGIAPLEPSLFNDAKSHLKGLEYAGLGIPFVASPTAEYRWFAETQQCGFLAKKGPQWQKHLQRLLTNRDFLLEESARVREIASRNTYEQHGHLWMDAWLRAYIERRRASA